MKFKIVSEEKEKLNLALLDFVDEYMAEFERQKNKRIMGFKVKINPIPPVISKEKDGLILNIPLPFPKWAMFMIKKKQWVEFLEKFLKEKNISFKEVKYIGD
jgi:hypothetical protein